METRISPHFRRSEFACRCGCGFSVVDAELLYVLEEVRMHFAVEYMGDNIKIEIMSGCRCPGHNRKVGGAAKSQHVFGIAADIKVWREWKLKQVPPSEVAAYFNAAFPDTYGVGEYSAWTHIDVRESKSRWRGGEL